MELILQLKCLKQWLAHEHGEKVIITIIIIIILSLICDQ